VTQPHLWDTLQPEGAHIWNTLGYRFGDDPPHGTIAIEWDASFEYSFPDGARRIVHGGMVATLLDTAMGHICLANVDPGQTFLTADLHVEFYRVVSPGFVRAEAEILHRSRRVMFCGASLYDSERQRLAWARCTQMIRSAP
jgi:uncharacterized protein (TIGR00369 family)